MKLHPAQQAFLQSEALYRAFCGGIGSGKSWAGSYDLIKRARPDRLYMAVAPTFGMLSDSTFRGFVRLAEELGVLADAKRSAPPEVRLKTGAEVIFRSADEADRLRGPNLSGVFMDEASLMDESVFHVLIGRLREGGYQGWLSACFTPKGKRHWTFETFATGRADTAIFYARTAENPFLPVGFHDTVRRQYTSALAAQELEGQFTDHGGAMFQPGWFPVVDAAPPLIRRVRAWDLAATPKDEAKARDPDFSAGVLIGRAPNADFIILDVKRLRGTPQHVQDAVVSTARTDGAGVSVYMEMEPGSAGKIVIDHYLRLLAGYPFFGVRSTGSKAERAQPLAAQAEGGAVKMLRAKWNEDFLDEIDLFPFGRHDDQVDAASLAFSKLAAWSPTCSPPSVLIPPPALTTNPTPPTYLDPLFEGFYRQRFERGEELRRRGVIGDGPPPWQSGWF